MKKTSKIELIQNIKHSKVSFFSIMFFVVLVVVLYVGFSWSSRSMDYSTNIQFEKSHLHDYEVTYPFCFSKKNIKSLYSNKYISEIEGVYNCSCSFSVGKKEQQAKIISIPKTMNGLIYFSGRAPENTGEIVVLDEWAKNNGIKVGDQIVFKHDDDGNAHYYSAMMSGDIKDLVINSKTKDGMKYLTNDKFTVTGLVSYSAAVCEMSTSSYGQSEDRIPNDVLMFVKEDAFDEKSYLGYSQIEIRCDKLRGCPIETEEYSDKEAIIRKDIEKSLNEIVEENKSRFSGFLSKDEQEETQRANVFMLMSRLDNPGYNGKKVAVDIMSKMKYYLTFVFFIVGAFVCFSAISRMVSNQKKQIGVKRANGFYLKEILGSYMCYTGLAVVAGVILGALIAYFGFMTFFLNKMIAIYRFEQFYKQISVVDLLCIGLLEAIVIAGSTYFACKREIKSSIVSQMKNETNHTGKTRFFEKYRLWNKMSLLFKTITNNCLNDKKRVLSTLVGVAGSTLLVVAAFSILQMALGSLDVHYNEIFHFNREVAFDNKDEETAVKIDSALAKLNCSSCKVYEEISTMRASNNSIGIVHMFAYDDKKFNDMVELKPVSGSEVLEESGVFVNEAFAKANGISVGEYVEYLSNTGEKIKIKIKGIIEYYIMAENMLVLSKNDYKSIFGKTPKDNLYLVSSWDKSSLALQEELGKIEGFKKVIDLYESSERSFNCFSSVSNAVLALYLLAAVAMSFLVLLNILFMFVEEKKGELIVLMINGYEVGDAKKYIYCDTIVLSVIGTIIGTVLGVVMSFLSVNGLETKYTNYCHQIVWGAIVVGILFSVLLTFVMTMIALTKIKKFRLQEINE